MMTNHERNMRTLIVCFVLLILALLPLRFMEVGQRTLVSSNTVQVLGEQSEEVVLPNAEVGF